MNSVLRLLILLLSNSLLAVVEAKYSQRQAQNVQDIIKIPISWDVASQKADQLIAQMNLTEKASMVTGSSLSGSCVGNIALLPHLNFSGLCLQDGPLAVNREDLVSVFPAGMTTIATWDRDLIYKRGLALGNEFRRKGVHIALGPCGGPLGRNPLGGRNWECFSPDPYLTGVAMGRTVTGLQAAGVQATSKHLIGNEQETQRSNVGDIEAYSANIDDRTLRELYLWPFADAVKAGTSSVMCAYNRVNQTYACENSELLNTILKEELGFNGYVMSDFFATHSGVKSILAGLDMNMPGAIDQASITAGLSYFGENVTNAINNGSVTMERLDDMVRRILTPYFLLGQDQDDFPTVDPSTAQVLAVQYGISGLGETPARDVRGDHAALIRELGAAGTVLVKNINFTLPLQSPKNIGVFGNDASDLTGGLTIPNPITGTDKTNTYGFKMGTLDVGGGSGSGRHTSIVPPLEAIKLRANQIGSRVQYILDNDVLANNDFHSIYPTPEVCIIFLKTYSSEGEDRTAFEADWQSSLVVENVAERCPNTVVVTHSAGLNSMPWAKNPNVKAIVVAHLPGEQSGNSIVDILFGDVNPSGKLPYTIPVSDSDYNIPIVNITNATSPDAWQIDFVEGQFIDYRHFDAKNITPLYEFGFGLSYTTFNLTTPLAIKNQVLNASISPDSALDIAPGGNPDLYTNLITATASVSNSGSVVGATVVQLYVSLSPDHTPSGTPSQVLRGFEKVTMEPGESNDLEFNLTRRDLSYWNVNTQEWNLPKGPILLKVGFSSRDIQSERSVVLL